MPIVSLDSGSDVLSPPKRRDSPTESGCRYAYIGIEPSSPAAGRAPTVRGARLHSTKTSAGESPDVGLATRPPSSTRG